MKEKEHHKNCVLQRQVFFKNVKIHYNNLVLQQFLKLYTLTHSSGACVVSSETKYMFRLRGVSGLTVMSLANIWVLQNLHTPKLHQINKCQINAA